MHQFGIANNKKFLKIKRLSYEALKKDKHVLSNFPIFSLHFLIPGPRYVDEICTEKIASPENVYFIIKQVNVTSLVKASFIKQFIKYGSLQAFSYKSKIGQQNFIALLPAGKLILYLEQRIAGSLRLKREHITKRRKKQKLGFHTFVIDTSLEEFFPGKKLYDSMLCELKKLDDIKFDLLLKWKPSGDTCPQSVRSYFENEGYECITCEPQTSCKVNSAACMPDVDIKNFDSSQMDAFLKWVGFHITDISLDPDNSDNFLLHCTEQAELSSNSKKPLKMNIYEGYLDSFQVLNLIEETKKLFEKHSDLPFTVICITGYLESFTYDKTPEFNSDDKMTTVLITRELNCWAITL